MSTQVAAEPKPSVRRRLLARLTGRSPDDATPRVGYRSLFRNRDYRLLFSGLTISMSGSWAYNVALVVFVFNATHSPAWVAAASMTRFLTALVTSPIGGLIADRMERVRLMVSLDSLALAFQTGLAVVAALNGPVVLAIVLAALTSITTSSYDPAARATTPIIVGEEHLAAANSAQSVVENLSIIVGPAIAGVLLLFSPPAVVFGVNAATFGFSALVVSRMRTRSHPTDITEGGTAGPLKQMGVGFRAFVSSPSVTLLAGFSILASFVYGTDTVLFVVISKNQLGTGSSGYGYLLAALGVGGILIAGFMNRVASAGRLGRIIVIGMAVYCLPTSLLTIVHSPWIAFVLEVVRGAGTIVVDVLAITALQRLVKPEVVARVFGVFFALVLSAISLGALLMPILLGSVGFTATLLIMGFAIPALCICAYPWIRVLDLRALRELSAIEPRIARAAEPRHLRRRDSRGVGAHRQSGGGGEGRGRHGAYSRGRRCGRFLRPHRRSGRDPGGRRGGSREVPRRAWPTQLFRRDRIARASRSDRDGEDRGTVRDLPHQRRRLRQRHDGRQPLTHRTGERAGAVGTDASVGLAHLRADKRGLIRKRSPLRVPSAAPGPATGAP